MVPIAGIVINIIPDSYDRIALIATSDFSIVSRVIDTSGHLSRISSIVSIA